MKIEIYAVAVGPAEQEYRQIKWRWRQKGGNGEIVDHGQSYTRKSSLKRFLAKYHAGVPIVEVVELA